VRNGKIHVELLGKFGSSKELDRSNLKSIDRILHGFLALEGVRGVILHGFLALISFYKSHSHTSLLGEFREQLIGFNFVHFVVYSSSFCS
jgi:hypothetical protein